MTVPGTRRNPPEPACDTPAATGAADVVVTNPDTQNGTLIGGFAYGIPGFRGHSLIMRGFRGQSLIMREEGNR